MAGHEWWQGAVIYQIYPRSFYDSNADGVGDLPGISQKMEYISSLGVDAVWISPFFKSPMRDFGYDISDYCAVDPLFGNMDDFDKLIAKAHQANIKVIIDQVLSHTSDQHPWFLESRSNQTNSKADWYVWADAKADGTAPNNWLSIFGGGAWQWEPRRQQYYLHNFLTSQPDLNFYNPEVQAAVLANVRFWLDKGVDGLRLDAINFCFHDALLRDNPAKPASLRTGRGFSADNPYAYQYHYFNNTQPENLAFLKKIRALMNEYPNTVTLGEISSEDSLATMAEYTAGGDKLHMGYSFELLTEDFSAQYLRNTVEQLEAKMRQGWPCWAISNHDVTRVLSRWGRGQFRQPVFANMLTALVSSLRGTVSVYQGEELGLLEAELDYHDLQDPYGIAFWPNFKGRDGCRTPHPWQEKQANAGFSAQKPWLPVPASHYALAVDKQEQEASSTLNGFRRWLAWRKQQSALQYGTIEFIECAEPVLLFLRKNDKQKLCCAFNLSAEWVDLPLPVTANLRELTEHGLQSGRLLPQAEPRILQLPAFAVFMAEMRQ